MLTIIIAQPTEDRIFPTSGTAWAKAGAEPRLAVATMARMTPLPRKHLSGPCTPDRGFTLIELLLVAAILGILVAIALPAYKESISRGRRADAQAALLGLAAAMERHYASQVPVSYLAAGTPTNTGAPKATLYPSQAPLDGGTKYYNLTIHAATATTYEVRAAPIAGTAQAGDRCGTFTLASTGVRDIASGAAGVTWQDCWR